MQCVNRGYIGEGWGGGGGRGLRSLVLKAAVYGDRVCEVRRQDHERHVISALSSEAIRNKRFLLASVNTRQTNDRHETWPV